MANRGGASGGAGAAAAAGAAQRPNGAAQGKICQFKLVLLGESAVGKSSLVLRFVKGQFHEYQESTIGGNHLLPVLFRSHLLFFILLYFSRPSMEDLARFTAFIVVD